MAATDLERLVVQLSADIKKYENAMRKAQGIANSQLGRIEKRAQQSAGSIAASFGRVGLAIAGAVAGSAVIRELGQLSDAATKIDNALKVAGLSGAELESTYQALAKAASDNGAPVQSLVDLYGKVSLVQKELNVSSADLIKFSGNVALALRVAGTDAQSASGALLQLSQALGGGTVRAEEFNSILEGAPTIARAAALGLKEAGGSVSALRNLVINGQLSSEAFFRAFEAGSVVLAQQASTSVLTFGQATTNLNNALVDAAREFNNATGAGENFANGIDAVAQSINSIEFDTFIQNIKDARSALDEFLASVGNSSIFEKLGQGLGVINDAGVPINLDKKEAETKIAGLERDLELLQEQIKLNSELGFDNTEALARIGEVNAALNQLRASAANMPDTSGGMSVVPGVGLVQTLDTGGSTNGSMGGSTGRGGARRVPTVNQVSINDFAAPKSTGGGGGGRAKKGGSGGQSGYAQEIEQIKERTAALQAETAALSQLDPLENDRGFALEKTRVAQELLTAAQNSGLAITPQLKATIDQLATGYATASVEAQKLADSQESMRAAAEDFRNTSKDVVSGFISDLRSGKSAAEALSGALNKVLDKVIDIALNSAFGIGGGGGGGGGGFLGGLFSLFGFAKGGYTGNGGKYQPAGIVHKGEYVFDKATTQKLGAKNLAKLAGYANGGLVGSAPSLPNMSGTRAKQQQIAVTVGVSSDNNGNLMPFVTEVAQREVSTAAPKIVSAATQQVVPTMSKYQNNKAGAEWR